MTEPTSGCTIDGEPAVVIRVAELNDLTARLHQAEAAARTTPDNPVASDDDTELTADEARDLATDLGHELYEAQDALMFAREMCDLADQNGTPVTTARVRQWLQGAPKCGRQAFAVAAPATADDGLRAVANVRRLMGKRIDDLTSRANKAEAATTRVRRYIAGQMAAWPDDYPVVMPARDVLAMLDAPWASTEPEASPAATDAEATIARVRALAADMRTWCSPYGIAVDYAQRIDDALDSKAGQ